jgi:MFS family permease
MTHNREVAAEEHSETSKTTVFLGMLFLAGNLSTGIYPALVSSLLEAGHATPSNVGILATAEFLPFGLMIVFAGRILTRFPMRLIAGVCLIVQILSAYATTRVQSEVLIGCRVLFGSAGGALVWLVYACISHSTHAGRVIAVYTTVLMTVAVLLSWLAPAIVLPVVGADGVILFLTVPSLLALLCLPLCPSQPPATSEPTTDLNRPALPVAAWLILFSVGLWSAFMTIFWVYSEPLAAAHTGPWIHYWLTVSLVFQTLGPAVAAVLVERTGYRVTISAGLVLSFVQVAAVLRGVGSLGFLAWTAVFGFLGWFLWPFFVAALGEIDPTRRSIIYLPAAQNLAGSLGPLLVSQFISDTDLSAGLKIDLAAIGIAPLLFWAAIAIQRQRSRAAGSSVAPNY